MNAAKILDIQGAIQEQDMPAKRTGKQKNIRFDPDTLTALQELKELHGTRFTESDIIRDAIVEKLERDKRRLNKQNKGA